MLAEKISSLKFSNNKILITGGASGIGLGLVERFMKETNWKSLHKKRPRISETV